MRSVNLPRKAAGPSEQIVKEQFVMFMSHLLKGLADEKSGIIMGMISETAGPVTGKQIQEVKGKFIGFCLKLDICLEVAVRAQRRELGLALTLGVFWGQVCVAGVPRGGEPVDFSAATFFELCPLGSPLASQWLDLEELSDCSLSIPLSPVLVWSGSMGEQSGGDNPPAPWRTEQN